MRGHRVAWQNGDAPVAGAAGPVVEAAARGIAPGRAAVAGAWAASARQRQKSFCHPGGPAAFQGKEQVLMRGYSITMDAATGEILREAKRVKAGQQFGPD